eukprot:8799573-Pyramimonas_sp.AAC.1
MGAPSHHRADLLGVRRGGGSPAQYHQDRARSAFWTRSLAGAQQIGCRGPQLGRARGQQLCQ